MSDTEAKFKIKLHEGVKVFHYYDNFKWDRKKI